MSDELVAWLRAQVDADEREAQWAADEAGGAAWTIRSTDVVLADDTDHYVSGNAQNEIRDHIARHDPARVLREVAAKRRMLDLHHPHPLDSTRALLYPAVAAQCDGCASMCHSETGLRCDGPDAPWPCETVKLLALPYAGREGYREEWRP